MFFLKQIAMFGDDPCPLFVEYVVSVAVHHWYATSIEIVVIGYCGVYFREIKNICGIFCNISLGHLSTETLFEFRPREIPVLQSYLETLHADFIQSDWLIVWWIDWLMNWLLHWAIDCLMDWLIDRSIDWVAGEAMSLSSPQSKYKRVYDPSKVLSCDDTRAEARWQFKGGDSEFRQMALWPAEGVPGVILHAEITTGLGPRKYS